MVPLLLFAYSDTRPSVNPSVFEYLYNVAGKTGEEGGDHQETN